MFGLEILEKRQSKLNGTVCAVRSLGLGTYLQVDGLTQSGGLVEKIWKQTLKKIQNSRLAVGQAKFKIQNCLILGLGGGSAAKIVRKLWPEAKITGVEIDSVMVEFGKKYLGLERMEIEIEIADAYQYLKSQNSNLESKLDLILVDCYVGYNVPEKFESDEFIKTLYKMLAKNGIVIFNRLYFAEKRALAVKFGDKLEKKFNKIERFYPEANLMLICKK